MRRLCDFGTMIRLASYVTTLEIRSDVSVISAARRSNSRTSFPGESRFYLLGNER